jgi:hypothetical protein
MYIPHVAPNEAKRDGIHKSLRLLLLDMHSCFGWFFTYLRFPIVP